MYSSLRENRLVLLPHNGLEKREIKGQYRHPTNHYNCPLFGQVLQNRTLKKERASRKSRFYESLQLARSCTKTGTSRRFPGTLLCPLRAQIPVPSCRKRLLEHNLTISRRLHLFSANPATCLFSAPAPQRVRHCNRSAGPVSRLTAYATRAPYLQVWGLRQ